MLVFGSPDSSVHNDVIQVKRHRMFEKKQICPVHLSSRFVFLCGNKVSDMGQ